MIAHADDDCNIPHSHSQTLFDAFLDQHLPPLPDNAAAMAGASDEVMENIDRLSKERWALRRDPVGVSDVPRQGRVEVFCLSRINPLQAQL
jgi:abhydrolase domain-containing protein 12